MIFGKNLEIFIAIVITYIKLEKYIIRYQKYNKKYCVLIVIMIIMGKIVDYFPILGKIVDYFPILGKILEMFPMTLNLGVILKYPWEYFEDFSQISKKLWENIRNVSTDA